MTQPIETVPSTASLNIQVLGGFSVVVGNTRISDSSWKLKKAKAVIKILAIAPGNRLHRDIILDTLWPELEPEAALNNLHKTLYVARRALEPGVSGSGSFLKFHDETVGLEFDQGLSVDSQQFESLVSIAQSNGDISSYKSALSLYRGELLPDDLYEEWSIARRDELGHAYQSLLSEYADLTESTGDANEAISALQQLIAVEPALESAHMRLMKLYAGSGDRHRAIKQYQSAVNTLQAEFGLEPQDEFQALYKGIVGGRTSFNVAPKRRDDVTLKAAEVRKFTPNGSRLVGREADLQKITPELELLKSGTGSVVLISGPAGVGKSRFAQEIAAKASSVGAHVMHGSAHEFERQLPYGPFSEAFDRFLQETPEGRRRAIMDAAPVDIYPLLPATTLQLNRSREVTESHDRPFLFSAVESLLNSLTATAPAALILDDLHAADETALELFHFLSRKSASNPVMLIVTYRSEGEAVHRSFARSLSALNRLDIGKRINLTSLDQQSVSEIVSATLGGDADIAVTSAVFAKAEGNPLYAEEIARTMLETGAVAQEGDHWKLVSDADFVPEAITSLLTDRIDRIDDRSKQLLSVAAVIGTDVPYQLLRSASGLNEDAVLDALDELLHRHILVESSDGYRFSHGLHHEVAYRAISRARRSKTHSDVARSILSIYPDGESEHSEALAHHFMESDQQEKAIPHLITSGQKASSVFANEEALDAFDKALEIIQKNSEPEDPKRSGELLDLIGDVHARIGNAQKSLDFYKQSMFRLETVEPMAGFKVRGKAALAAINAEQVEEGESLLESILANISPEMPDFAVARTYLLLAQIGWHSADHGGAIEAAEKALKAAVSSGDDTEAARAYEAMALSCHSLGDWQKGIEYELSRAQTDVPGFDTDTAFDAHL